MHTCHKVIASVKKTYVNDTHSTVESLSYYFRAYGDRSNQSMEGSNRFINSLRSDAAEFKRRSFESWIMIVRKLERLARNRVAELDGGDDYKPKTKKLQTRDKAFGTLVNKHNTGEIDTKTFLKGIVKLNNDCYSR